MKRFTVALICMLGVSSLAETVPDYLAHYRDYAAAAERGDLDSARESAALAWASAEATLGEDRLTAILAFNFGRLALYREPPRAVEALRRAAELQPLVADDVAAEHIELYLAFATFKTESEPSRRDVNRLRDLLESIAPGLVPAGEVGAMWHGLAIHEFSKERYDKAHDDAARAATQLRKAGGVYRTARASALLTKGASTLLHSRWTMQRALSAHIDFHEAWSLFPPQPGIATFDELLAQIIAWNAAASAVRETLRNRSQWPDHEHRSSEGEIAARFVNESELDDCDDLEWGSRRPPSFPSEALRSGTVGAALIGFNVDDTGAVIDARVLGEVPARRFGEAALETLRDWRLRNAASLPERCRRNQITQMVFAIQR